MKLSNYFSAVLLMTSAAAYAQEAGDPRIGLVFGADLEFGGDDVATVTFQDGDTQDVTTGDGLTLAVGGYLRPIAALPFSVRATAGYKYAAPGDDDCRCGCDCDFDSSLDPDVELERWVFESVASYMWPSGLWVGAGVTHHARTELDGNGFVPNLAFDDATGPTFELGWKWLALSYTDLEYTDTLGGRWDSESYGLTFSIKLDQLLTRGPRVP